ncbi:hypothetical protein ADN00_10095 [Ornatilinea apprima]|uniref:Peptide deformylase n=1 Tax=Ornatilinea apprima TaxID=1134406 RepID=A0A0P6XB19_9CHLR|nr:peptide deformylase [Ornatilinea apprima]KPL76935.1 hypothetical protein ADN00_10095 [Ornatilinea apprima]
MAVREILIYPQSKNELRAKSQPVEKIDKSLKHLIADLKDTLQAHENGIGLASPQINVHKQVVIVCLGYEQEGEWVTGPPEALINPRVIEAGDERRDFDGCLSFPGLYGETIRPHLLRVTGLDEQGQPFDRYYEGFNAVVVHHEIDHLEGVLFIDRVQSAKDLYTLEKNTRGQTIRVPFNAKIPG